MADMIPTTFATLEPGELYKQPGDPRIYQKATEDAATVDDGYQIHYIPAAPAEPVLVWSRWQLKGAGMELGAGPYGPAWLTADQLTAVTGKPRTVYAFPDGRPARILPGVLAGRIGGNLSPVVTVLPADYHERAGFELTA
jgi:hypothetical protein